MVGNVTSALNNSIIIKYTNGRRDIVRKTGEDSYKIQHAAQEGVDGGWSTEDVVGKDNMYDKINGNTKNDGIDSVTIVKEDGSRKTFTLNDDYTINESSSPKPGYCGAYMHKLSYEEGIEMLKNLPNQLGISKLFKKQ